MKTCNKTKLYTLREAPTERNRFTEVQMEKQKQEEKVKIIMEYQQLKYLNKKYLFSENL